MIKKISLCVILIAAGLTYFTPEDHHSYSNTTGSPGGYTNSPGDGTKTCRTCHGPGAVTVKQNVITTNIPASGYVPNTTYTVTIAYTEQGRSKYGFEATSENSANAKKGTFSTANTNCRTIGTSRITHTSAGSTASGGTFVFNWTAPSAGSGAITFYAVLNATNSNSNDDGGDNIYTTTAVVTENTSSGIADYISALGSTIELAPNPVVDVLNLRVPAEFGTVSKFEVYDLNGKMLLYTPTSTINVSALPAGTYIVKVNGEQMAIKRFVKL